MSDVALRDEKAEGPFYRRAEDLLGCINNLLALYMPFGKGQEITMLVGRKTEATIKFSGPVTQDAIADTLAHLAFYKKYFPKTEEDLSTITAETIIQQLRAALAEDREARK